MKVSARIVCNQQLRFKISQQSVDICTLMPDVKPTLLKRSHAKRV